MLESTQSTIDITKIIPGERFRKDYGNLDSLEADIKEHGLIHPIAIVREPDDTFMLLAGGRRFKACLDLGWKEIPCNVYEPPITDFARRSIELMENVIRKDMTFEEEVRLKREIHKHFVAEYGEQRALGAKGDPKDIGWSLTQTAKVLGMDVANLGKDIKLANALEVLPELKSCKNASEARKELSRVSERIAMAELNKRMLEQKSQTPEAVARQRLIDSYVIGDCFERLAKLADESIDFIHADPPYAIELRKNIQTSKDEDENLWCEANVDYQEYYSFMLKFFTESYRVLRNERWLVCWLGISWYDLVQSAAKEAGFEPIAVPGYWVKNNGTTRLPYRTFANYVEVFLYMSKGKAQLTIPGQPNAFQFAMPQNKIHPTEKPVEMLTSVMARFVLPHYQGISTFAGSGNELLAMSNLGLTAVGFELSSAYREGFISRVLGGKPGEFK